MATSEKKSEKDLLDEELEKLKKSNRALDYGSYLASAYETDARTLYGDALDAAAKKRSLGKAGYGSSGEALSALGLSRSGYADYLGSENERAYERALDEARDAYRIEEGERARSYKEYLAGYEKQQKSKLSAGVKQMLANNFESADEAYRYALAVGMDEERASLLREMSAAYGASGFRRSSLASRIAVLENISRGYMSDDEAYQYALALGAPEETAEQIARFAEVREYGSLIDWAEKIGS